MNPFCSIYSKLCKAKFNFQKLLAGTDCSPSEIQTCPLLRGKESTCNAGDLGLLNPWVGKIPWRRKWQPTPVCLPGEFHGQSGARQFAIHGVAKSQDMTEQLTHYSCYYYSTRKKALRTETLPFLLASLFPFIHSLSSVSDREEEFVNKYKWTNTYKA